MPASTTNPTTSATSAMPLVQQSTKLVQQPRTLRLCAVEWVNYELVSLGPGDSMTIPEGKHFLANTFKCETALSFQRHTRAPRAPLFRKSVTLFYRRFTSLVWNRD